jgi:hypothetical protein
MRGFLSKGLLMFAGVVSLPSSVTHHFVTGTPLAAPAADYRIDPRLVTLQEFFTGMRCPALAVSEVFLEVADSYGLDWRLLPSISVIESGGGKTARNNNLFGWDSGNAEFESPGASVEGVAYALANSHLYKDKSLDAVLNTYNPNSGYARKVKSVMERISPSE